MKRKGSYRLWFSLVMLLGMITWLASLGMPTGMDTGINRSDLPNIGSNESSFLDLFGYGWEVATIPYDLTTQYDAVVFVLVIPAIFLGIYTLVSWVSPGGGG